MGETEAGAKKVRRRGEVERAVLVATATAGLLAVAALAPNALAALRYIPKSQKRFLYQARTVAGRLADKGLVIFVESGGKKYLRLTAKGQTELELAKAKTKAASEKPKKWDRRFRVVIFDIPQEKGRVRYRLRGALKVSGFLRLQNSVWVYPYDCEELLILLKANLKLGKEVLYMVVEKIENDRSIRMHFNLPQH